MSTINRSGAFFAAFLSMVAFSLLSGCRDLERQELRIAFLPNVTHAVPMVGSARGQFRSAAGRPVEMVPFNSGPSAIEALFAGDVDFAYCGPGPAINAFVRTAGKVRILAGAASGGTALVVREEYRDADPGRFAGAVLASPQIGNSQDVALRKYLWDHDLASRDQAGTVVVVPMRNPDILSMFRTGELDGAWVPEPWATRLVEEADGHVYLDEASLWPDGRYPTTLLVTHARVLRGRPEEVAAILEVNAAVIRWIRANPRTARARVNEQLELHTGKPLPEATLEKAWDRLQFTDDPILPVLRENARAARRIGYLPTSDIRGIVVDPERIESAE